MPVDKSLLTGSTALLVMKLLEEGDKYGYQMVDELRRRSENVFELRSGTLYPLLHTLAHDIVYQREGKPIGRLL